MPNESNLRSRFRPAIYQPIVVYESLRQLEVGRLVNIHREGFMVICSDAISSDCLYQIELHFAEPVQDKTKICVGAECLWTRETDGGDQSWAGFHIIDVSEDDIVIIDKLASNYT